MSFISLRKKQVAWALILATVLFYMTIVQSVFYLAEERQANCLVYWNYLLSYYIWLLFNVSFILPGKEKQIAWFIGVSYCIINMTIVLFVIHLAEKRKADCLVYWCFVLYYQYDHCAMCLSSR